MICVIMRKEWFNRNAYNRRELQKIEVWNIRNECECVNKWNIKCVKAEQLNNMKNQSVWHRLL
jgi:hypothetical protein